MLKTGKRIRRKRKFSEDFKLKIVKEYESGEFSVVEMTKIYDISYQTIYNWIYKYSIIATEKWGIGITKQSHSCFSRRGVTPL